MRVPSREADHLPGPKLSYSPGTLPDMTETTTHQHHSFDYIELTVTDVGEAKRFYGEAFGWTFNDCGPEYAGIRNPRDGTGPEVGGLRAGDAVRPEDLPADDAVPPGNLRAGEAGRPGGPLVLLYSADLEQSVSAVQQAGGRVVNGPYSFPGGRRFHFTDPSGNELGVWSEGG